MRRKTLRGGRAASSTKPSRPTVNAIPLLHDEDDAAVPRTSIESDHDLPCIREVGAKENLDNAMNEGSNRSSHDSLGDDYICVDFLDKKICISCNEGGEVLSCAERDCPVTFHPKCFCAEPKFDDRGNFYCPYCWYKRALAEAQEFRKKALLAKEELVKFFRQNVIMSDKPEQNNGKNKRNELKEEVGNGGNLDHCNRQGNDSVHSQPLKKVGDQPKEMERVTDSANQHGIAVQDEAHANPQIASTGDSRQYREEKTPVHIEPIHNDISKTRESRSVREKEGIVTNAKPLSAFRFGEHTDGHSPDIAFTKETQENVEVYIDNKDGVKDRENLVQNELRASATDSSVSEPNVSDSEARSMKKNRVKYLTRRTANSHRVSSVGKSLPLKSDIEGKNASYKNKVATSETLRLPQGSLLQGCSKKLTLPTGKRKRLNWTTEEENVLKEGVLRFAMENRNIPWKKILEFGCHVFDSNRTPADLKDKWKHMRV